MYTPYIFARQYEPDFNTYTFTFTSFRFVGLSTFLLMLLSDSILESWPKKKKDLFEEIGIETDEDVGVCLPKM